MQTFLPHPNFTRSAEVLDRQRLGKQRVEVLQILKVLRGETEGWKSHPIVKAWRGYENALGCYGLQVCAEWKRRGYTDSCERKIARYMVGHPFELPPWIGREEVHSGYRSLLLYKDFAHYSKFGWAEDPSPKIDYSLLGGRMSVSKPPVPPHVVKTAHTVRRLKDLPDTAQIVEKLTPQELRVLVHWISILSAAESKRYDREFASHIESKAGEKIRQKKVATRRLETREEKLQQARARIKRLQRELRNLG